MSYNPSDYTRCEKCKHIDRENEKCKITNDNWLVSDRAGTCHQFEGVESMKVKCIDNKGFASELEVNKEYEVLEVKHIDKEKYFCINMYGLMLNYNSKYFEIVEDKISRIDLVLNSDDFPEYDYKQDIIECRCPSEFGLKEYKDKQCNSTDYDCCLKCWSEFATKEEVEKLLSKNKNEKLVKEFEENVKKGAETLAKCSMSSIDMKNGNNVNHPSHYNKGIEAIKYIESWDMNFNIGNVIKYVSRAKYKGKELEDLQKAAWYLDKEIERVKANA